MGTLERGEANVSLGNLQRLSKALGITLSGQFRTVEKRAEGLGRLAARRPEKRQPLMSTIGLNSPALVRTEHVL